MKEMNGTNGTDAPVANRPGANVEEILALVKLAQRTEDAEELRGLLAGAKALCRHAIHKARYKAARAARAAIPGDDLEAVKGDGKAAAGKAYVSVSGGGNRGVEGHARCGCGHGDRRSCRGRTKREWREA